jgi:enamine deaminase RidA (YjgF/YER057c/UK114 family)
MLRFRSSCSTLPKNYHMSVEQKHTNKQTSKRESVVPKDMQEIPERFHYSPGVKAGPFLFIAGQVGRDEKMNVVENKEAQLAQAFENVKKVLTTAGLTFDDVVDMITYLPDMRDLALLMKVKDQYFTNLDSLPTWTAIGTTVLANPGLFVEIKCTALLRD